MCVPSQCTILVFSIRGSPINKREVHADFLEVLSNDFSIAKYMSISAYLYTTARNVVNLIN